MLPSSTFLIPLRRSACALALSGVFSVSAHANPAGASVVAGQASIINQGNLTTVTNSNGAVINWQSFSIGKGEITRFVQPSAASSVLNRVVGSDPSSILGQLQSNGRVFLINQAGILVGAGARVDVAGFVASSLNLRTEDFLANRLNFQATPGAGLVRNEGTISTPQGGQVFMVAPMVENAGSISVPRGDVIMAAGRSVQFGDTGLPGVRIEVAGGESVQNVGSVAADAGRIGLFGALVRNSGSLNASSAVAEGGRILLRATARSVVDGDARVVATGSRGGRVEVLGDTVAVADRAVIDTSGGAGGGVVLVGGDYQGGNPEVRNAHVAWVGPGTSLRADANESGDGGKVVVWADDTTRAYGSVSARGGALAGNGGLIETSGKRHLDVDGIRINASAPNGRAGTWLLDPEEMRVVENGSPGSDINITPVPNFAPLVGTTASIVSADTLRNAINTNSNVTLATAAGPGTGTGDITFDASGNSILIAKTGNTFNSTLNVNAYRNIVFTGGSTTFRTTAGAGAQALSVNLNAGNGNSLGAANVFTNAGATVNLDATGTAPVTVLVGNGKIWHNNGTVNLTGQSAIKLPTQVNPFPAATSMPATFQNNGTFNNNSSASWFIVSNPTNQDGVFDNFGTVNTVGGSVEAIYNNNPGATLNLLGANTLSLQNAQLMRGTVNVPNTGGTIWISEYHGVVTRFHDTTALGAGRILVQAGGAPEADFQRFSGGGITLEVGAGGNATVTNGRSLFGSVVNAGGAIAINGGTLGVAGNFSVPVTGITYAGNAGLAAEGNLSLSGGTFGGANNLSLAAGGNLGITNATVSATGALSIAAGGVVGIDNSTVGATGSGGNSVSAGGSIIIRNGSIFGNAANSTSLTGGLINIESATVNGNITSLIANNLVVSGGGTLSASDKVRALVARNVTVDGAAGNSSIVAANDLNIALASPDSVVNLAGSALGQSLVKTTGPAGSAIRVLFTNRVSGGLIVDGASGIGPGAFGSGFRSSTGPAVLGQNLFVVYAPNLPQSCPPNCPLPPPVPIPPKPPQPKPEPAASDEELGDFGGGKRKARPGVCKAA